MQKSKEHKSFNRPQKPTADRVSRNAQPHTNNTQQRNFKPRNDIKPEFSHNKPRFDPKQAAQRRREERHPNQEKSKPQDKMVKPQQQDLKIEKQDKNQRAKSTISKEKMQAIVSHSQGKKKEHHLNWTEEEIQKLKQIILNKNDQKEKINWDDVAAEIGGNKTAVKCYNKHITMNEPEWTKDEEETIGKLWEANYKKFNVQEAQKTLKGKHSIRGIQFKMINMTQTKKYQPLFILSQEDMQKIQ